jgi:hypothetical protein
VLVFVFVFICLGRGEGRGGRGVGFGFRLAEAFLRGLRLALTGADMLTIVTWAESVGERRRVKAGKRRSNRR